MELRHLRYLVAVAQHGGFGRASKALYVSQSAISEQIHDLEIELGVDLFDRSSRRIRLTHYGEQFLLDAKAVLELADRAVSNIRRSARGEIGTLTIGFFVGGTGTFFPRLIREFRAKYPNVRVTLVEMAPAMQHQALINGEINIGFSRPVQPIDAALLRSEPYRTDPIDVVMLKSHRLAKRRSLSVAELADETFILNNRSYSPIVFDKVISLCAEAGFSPKIGAVATVSPGVLTLVEAGEGVAILPRGSRVLGSKELVFIPLDDPGASIEMVIAWSPQHETPVFRSFLELARKKRR